MLTFYRMTSKQYQSLSSKDPDGIYFLTDSLTIHTGSKNYSHGITGNGHVIGGYCAGISDYSEKDNIHRLTLKGLDDELDMSKFSAGQKLILNIPNSADVNNGEELLYQSRTIIEIDAENKSLILDSSLYNTNISQLDYEQCFCMVEDKSRNDNATTDGDKNFVTGVRAHAHGSWNTVPGMAAEASGINNIASGLSSQAEGTYTTASGNSAHAEGIRTKATGMASHAEGSSTTASGDASFAGGTSSEASGDNSFVWGFNSKAQGNQSQARGMLCIATGSCATAQGYRVRTDAVKSQIFGMDGTLESAPENEGAIAFAGGSLESPEIPFLFRMRRPIDNPEYNPDLDEGNSGTDSNGESKYKSQPGFSLIYAGRIQPKTLVSDDTDFVLDHDKFSRWENNAENMSLSLKNWDDGDYGEVVFFGNLILPEEWIKHGNMTNSYPVNILQIEKIGEYVFCQLKYKQEE